MDDSEDNMSAEDLKLAGSPRNVKSKPKKRSLIERELETSLTARVTSPVASGDGTSTSRYGRSRRLKSEVEQPDAKKVTPELKSPLSEKSPMKTQSPVYKMHASNSPLRKESPKNNGVETFLDNQIESIYQENISLSRFGTEEVKTTSPSPAKKFPKVYIRKDLIQKREPDETVMFIKNMFSPVKSARKSSTHLNNILERSSERYSLNTAKQQNGFLDNSSVVKMLDFDSKKKKKDSKEVRTPSKSDLFELEARCPYQVGDLAWARMGTYPFWPSIVTRDPSNGVFVKKKLFGRIERDVIHVTFFGDNGRRGWIVDTMLRKYLGQLEFESTRENFTPEDRKKDPRLYAAFFVSDKKQALWNLSVEEAEMLLREPKRLRIDIFNDMLEKSRARVKQQKSGKISRTGSDVSLSESLYDSLFSEDDGKVDNTERSRNRSRNKSLDVFEVVTACLDNMAAKTGITKIQRQSHMDRWLQKAKSKTPEKTQTKLQVSTKKLEEKKETKVSSAKKKKIKSRVPVSQPYSLRKSTTESQNLLPFQNEHDYSRHVQVTDSYVLPTDTDNCKKKSDENSSGMCVILKVESLADKYKKNMKGEEITVNGDSTNIEKPEKPETRLNGICESPKNKSTDEISQNNSSITSITTSSGNNNTIEEEDFALKDSNKDQLLELSKCKDISQDNNVVKRGETASPVYKDPSSEDIAVSKSTANDDSNSESENLRIEANADADSSNAHDEYFENCTVINPSLSELSDMSIDERGDDPKSQNNTESIGQTDVTPSLNEVPIAVDSMEEEEGHNNRVNDSNIEPMPDLTFQKAALLMVEEESLTNGNSKRGSKNEQIELTMTEENNLEEDLVDVDTCKNMTANLKSGQISNASDVIKNTEVENTNELIFSINAHKDHAFLNDISNDNNEIPINKINDAIPNHDNVKIITNNRSLNNNINVKEVNVSHTKEAHIPISTESIKENGFHDVENHINGDVDLDTLSVHSEDSVKSTKSESRRKLRSKQDNKQEDPLENVEFSKYLQLRQDAVMDENPELTQNEIVAYLHKTWLYEESVKSDDKKNDDLRESNLVKGLNHPQPTKGRKKKLSINKNSMHKFMHKKNRGEKKLVYIEVHNTFQNDEEAESARDNKLSNHSLESNEISTIEEQNKVECNETEIALGIATHNDTQKNKEKKMSKDDDPNNQKHDNSIENNENSNLKPSDTQGSTSININDQVLEEEIDTSNVVKINFDQPTSNTAIKEDFDGDSIDSEDSEAPLIRCKLRSKSKKESSIKEGNVDGKFKEDDADTISINSGDSEISLSKRKKKFNSRKVETAMEDSEFIKYLELRQDSLIEENPELTQDEIVAYLYQTWLYEENNKSEIKKSDDIEQSGLVKGVKDIVQQPKKVKRKIKAEKDTDDDLIPKDKPKRKVIKPYYNEEFSDIEEELEVFAIFKPKNKQASTSESASNDQELEQDENINVIDDVELYFEELTKPKPNIFKGLIREKVCEICENIGRLVKCKGCNGMFHVDCVKNEIVKVEIQMPTRGRKKKKKAGRRPKNADDSDNHDDKSQDVSEDNNASIEEVIESESHTVDADTLEAQLTAKMKEILDNTEQVHYDSYTSDDGLDWTETVPGKCEIIDVKLKPRNSNSEIDYSDFKCNNCQKYETPVCFVCKSAVSKKESARRQKCHVAHCHKYYHLECLDHWPQTQFNGGEPSKNNKKINEYFEALTCPRHVCHTCVSDDPRGCKTRFSGDKLARCVRCPATYHSFTKCLPAGTQVLTASHIICPRHYEHRPGKVPCHVNTGWCFICALGGSLICCEYCPTSFHAECLNIKPPEGGYMCEDCETGRLPLYGEMVWVKLGHYRWWPGIILHPSEIPENIYAVKHNHGEFVVRFFGQYDHYWVNRGRVFPFQEGDSGRISSQKSKIDAAFTTAMEHAQRACEILKSAQPNEEESLDIASSLLPPHYVKLKVNKPCGSLCGRKLEDPESSLTQCECNPNDEDPCGPYSQCLNRMLLTECGPTCRAGDRCNNRAFEKRLYPKLVPYRTPSRGWGLKTLEEIKSGQFVIEYVGELIDEVEFRRRMVRKHEIRDENFYFLTLDKERMIDAGPKGNLARFMNHCCEPNCETQKWTVLGDVRVGLFALYDIPANSEVTFNYNLECAGIEKKRCMCGAKRCSGYIGAKPKQEESQTKKSKIPGKRTYKKRKTTEESPSTKNKPKRPIGRPPKPRELTEIEKDLLIIRNATNGLSSDESSRSMSSEYERNPKALKRKRVSFSSEDILRYDGLESPNVKKHKMDEKSDVGD